MNPFHDFDWSFKSIAKVLGVVLLGVFALTIVIALFSFSVKTVFQTGTRYNDAAYDDGYYGKIAQPEAMMAESIGGKGGGGGYYMPPYSPSPTGSDAEDYEVKTFNATIKTRKLEKVCGQIADLKTRPEVIFETANINEDNCYFSFKVKKANEAEIAAFVESLKPEDNNVNVQTIKGTLESYDKQLEILENKLTSIEDTLTKSQRAYDEVTKLATQKQDVESLAKIIDSKLNLIERLSTQRIQVKEEIDRYKQGKADEADRLNYSFFNVSVTKDLILDWKQIKESWKYEMRAFVENFNGVLQGISVNLLTYFIRFVQVAIYFFLSVFLLKYGWFAVKKIWKGRNE